ncbi:hypothetical protein HHK36_004672 [Tetracentron sinense]|uniref:PGG domain-containing protein n=1 Tax=Tetracentron sinense TaxID=13715 RepID=A0A834ZJW7_TETSI|nr:hypothetical protein HHK36_004672 [Tetracentron sinense]
MMQSTIELERTPSIRSCFPDRSSDKSSETTQDLSPIHSPDLRIPISEDHLYYESPYIQSSYSKPIVLSGEAPRDAVQGASTSTSTSKSVVRPHNDFATKLCTLVHNGFPTGPANPSPPAKEPPHPVPSISKFICSQVYDILPMNLLMFCMDLMAGNKTTIATGLTVYVPLYRAALRGDWEMAQEFLNCHPGAVHTKITRGWETALHIAAAARHTLFVEELVKLMTTKDLALKNKYKNTALCFAAASGVVRIAEVMVRKNEKLPNIRGSGRVIPLYMAALLGHRDMVHYLYSVTKDENLTTLDRIGLLVATITTNLYDVAFQILHHHPELATVRDRNGETALHVLARKPWAFASGRIHVELPNESNFQFKSHMITKVPGFRIIHEKKLLHIQAHELVKCLWQQVLLLDDSQIGDLLREPSRPLFAATEFGIVEVVTELIHTYPDLIWKVDNQHRTIFHTAVAHRQQKIFNLIFEIGALKDLITSYKDDNNNNMLHLAGKMAPSNQLNTVSGAALQMQRELLWFKEVEKIVQPLYREMRNSEGRTPRMLFTEEHKGLVKEGEKWMKSTAASCMLVATLITTVMFAAIFTVPGGNNDHTGIPILLQNNSFIVFAMSDALALFSSVTSILNFLSILTSRYAEEDFLEALPKRLIIGLATLFFSIVNMLIAFGATFFIVLRHRLAWILIPVTLITCIPPTLFVILQFPLLADMIHSTCGSGILNRTNGTTAATFRANSKSNQISDHSFFVDTRAYREFLYETQLTLKIEMSPKVLLLVDPEMDEVIAQFSPQHYKAIVIYNIFIKEQAIQVMMQSRILLERTPSIQSCFPERSSDKSSETGQDLSPIQSPDLRIPIIEDPINVYPNLFYESLLPGEAPIDVVQEDFPLVHNGFPTGAPPNPSPTVPIIRTTGLGLMEYVPLYRAALKGDWEMAQEFLNSHPGAVHAKITKGWETALHIAAGARHTAFVEELVKQMTIEDLALKNKHKNTALCFAAASGIVRIAEVMVRKNKLLPFIRGSSGVIPLCMAALLGHRDMVHYLYSVTKDENLTTDDRIGLLVATITTDLYGIHIELPNESKFHFKSPDYQTHLITKVPGFRIIHEKKLLHIQAHELVKRLWQQVLLLDDSQIGDLLREPSRPLFAATEFGIVEFVTELICSYPDLIWKVDNRHRSIFHTAVAHRQQNIFNLIFEIGALKDLITSYKDDNNNNMLHLAAKMAPLDQLNTVSGAALQMQQELLWFKEVEKIVQPLYREMRNSEGRTPRMLFTEEHKGLVKEGERWMKNTATSCMLLATLITTMMFAAIFTVPGGNNDHTGIPILLNNNSFIAFAVSDALALFSSVTSILNFLSILTSRYAEGDFLKALPKRLIIGLATLFFSIVNMLIAFGATFLIVLEHRLAWILIPVILIACIPPTLFAILQFPLLADMIHSTYGSGILNRTSKHMLF